MITLLFISLTSFRLPASATVGDEEHAYVRFQEDFEDGEAGDWLINIPPEAPPGSGWAVELDEGSYVLSESGQVWAEAGDFTWTNYTYEVKVKLLTPQGGQINFRMSGPAGRYLLGFHSGGLYLRKEYPSWTFYDLKDTELFLNLIKWYTFTIVCVGSSIEVYVDDILKLNYVDEKDPLLSGRIGFESGPESHIHYDDVKVCTTHRLYVAHLIKEAQDKINAARRVNADTSEAEQRLAEARVAFEEGNLSSAESLTKEALNLAEHAPVGPVSVEALSKYFAEYDQRTVEVSGTIRDIRYEESVYRFAVDDGTGVVSATYDGTLGEIKTDDMVKVVGTFDAPTTTVIAESVEKMEAPAEGLYTFLIFKDDFEDGDFSGWRTDVDPEIEGSAWKVEREGDNYILSGEGHCGSEAGDPEWTDYIFEFKIKLIKGMVQINFRMTMKPEAPDRYILRLSRVHVSSFAKGEMYLNEQRIVDLKQMSIDFDPDKWYTVKIVCVRNNIKMYLDGVLKLDYTDEDSPFLSGLLELEPCHYEDNKPSHIHFDDVKVSKIVTTSDIDDLITYAQSEIDKAREVNADVSASELKLEQAKQALVQEDYQIVQYLVDEAVWMAKSASVGQISIKDLRALATKISGHTVTITGTVKDLEARYGVGYEFTMDDGTGGIHVTYQGALVDVGNEYKVKVTGIFDAPSVTVTASRIEKISGPPESPMSDPLGINWSIGNLATLISIGGAGVGVIGWFVRHERMEKRRKVLFTKLMDEVDAVYSRFKMNAVQCEAELYKLKDEVLDEFKQGLIDEKKHNVLESRINGYMQEIKDEITRKESDKDTGDTEKDLDQ